KRDLSDGTWPDGRGSRGGPANSPGRSDASTTLHGSPWGGGADAKRRVVHRAVTSLLWGEFRAVSQRRPHLIVSSRWVPISWENPCLVRARRARATTRTSNLAAATERAK